MRIRRTESGGMSIEMSTAEARVFLEELSDVQRGSKLPKVRQICAGIAVAFKYPVPVPSPDPAPVKNTEKGASS